MSKMHHIVFICGHYRGVDQRVIDKIVDEEISIGNFILTGGEIALISIIDSILRLLPGVLGNDDSNKNETFSDNLFEFPNYTRPKVWKGIGVPHTLISGNHEKIKQWRKLHSIINTFKKRKEMLNSDILSIRECDIIKQFLKD